MLRSSQFWILTAAGTVALVLALVNMVLFQANTTLRAEATGRAQYIQQSITLEGLYRQIVQELADRAVRTRDQQIRDMLAAEGLKIDFDAPPGAGRAEQP